MAMAMQASVSGSAFLRAPTICVRPGSVRVSFAPPMRCVAPMRGVRRPGRLHVRAVDTATAMPEKIAPAILLSDKAATHLKRLKAANDSLLLRIGVRQGGCSGMSYVMDFEDQSKIRPEDSVIEAEDIKLVCDPKSLLFLFGMQLDYSDALIGGGFSFNNPNATSSCGCGKSFAA